MKGGKDLKKETNVGISGRIFPESSSEETVSKLRFEGLGRKLTTKRACRISLTTRVQAKTQTQRLKSLAVGFCGKTEG